ncbi:uncharacterized protein LOC135689235, partial [Rhopilema esculentum]|uniref:uncharacterized protein LOC135689235 n=1 Tax=Rhopilema esculentum TaxID=499914 RepID=UPI0031DBF333
MDELKKKRNIRGGHRAFATQLIRQIEDSLEDQLKLKQLEIQLDEKFEVLGKLDDEILGLVSEIDEDGLGCSQEISEAGEMKEKINLALLKLKSLVKNEKQLESQKPNLTRHGSEESVYSVESSASSATRKVRAKLPKLELKKFSGRPQDWQEFWDSYKSAVYENEEISKIDKFSYLKHYLEEPAKKVIAGLALTEKNYDVAVDLLEQRFARPTTIKRAHINELLNLDAVFNEKHVKKMRELYDTIETHHRGLKALGVDETSYSNIVVPVLMDKVPEAVRLNMIRGSKNHQEWDMEEMLVAFREELEIREQHVSISMALGNGTVSGRTSSERRSEMKPRFPGRTTTASALFTKQDGGFARRKFCVFCKEDHEEADCHNVRNKEERKDLVFKYGRCLLCLKKGHRAYQCHSKEKCKLCNKRHHVAICNVVGSQPSANQARVKTADTTVTTSCVSNIDSGGRAVLQTAKAVVTGNIRDVKARVLFDSGSQRSFVTRSMVEKLGLNPIKQVRLGIKTFGSQNMDEKIRDVVELELKGVESGGKVKIQAFVVNEVSEIRNEHVEILKYDYKHLTNLWFSDVCRHEDSLIIDILVGSDWLWTLQDGRIIRGEPGEPVAIHTKIGWVVSGPIKGKLTDLAESCSSNLVVNGNGITVNLMHQNKEQELEQDIKKLWDLETLGIKRQDKVHAEFLDNIEFKGDRYSVCLPWKMGHKPLSTNYTLSLNRLKGQLKKLKEKPAIMETYDGIIKQQERDRIIEEVTSLELSEKLSYLPHHAVVRNDAETTNVRIVYDASAKDRKSGTSLNECLHVGPPLNPLLFDIMIRFRENKIAITSDIEKAFLNIEVDKKDRDCLRFLWIDSSCDSEPNIKVYRFNRVVFGVNSSPFLLNAVVRHHLSTYETAVPEFSAKLSRSFYVDDLVLGCYDEESGKELYNKAKKRMLEAGFNLRKWKSNDPKLAQYFKVMEETGKHPADGGGECSYVKEMLGEEISDTKSKVLGITWDMLKDNLEFELTKIENSVPNSPVTKRTILSMISKLFDPLGLVSPIIVSAKVLFQELCTLKLGWDDEVPVEMLNKWNKFVCDLSSVGVISLPRCLYEKSTDKVNKCYLHGFADASKKAYCAMVYLVCETDTGMHSRLICAKTRVAPLKELSIPRLELMSGRILSTLVETVYNALSPQIRIDGCRYWLDSKTALYWINNQGEWRQFVQHRVNEILKISKKEDWGHCIGVCNPADLGSRRVSATILRDSRLWWEGPHWLSMGKEYWPKSFTLEDSPEIMEEKRKTVNVTAVIEQNRLSVTEIIEVDKFSFLKKLLRVTARVIRFVTNLRSAREGKILKLGELDSEEVSRAERIWIKGSQIDLKKQPGYNEIALKLGLFEEDGILKCKGRLENSDLALETKFPIILPNNNWFTRLVIEDCHERVMHEGLKATLTEYRSSFWTTKGRQYVKKILRDCRKCKKVQGKSYGVPSVAPLPEFRVKEVPPFTYIGIDFAGPLFYKSKIGKMEKCYIALYTCATSRAIHLDLVEDMSGPTFIRSLRRFTSRRGTPSLINSDNAKTFKFTNKFLDKLGNSREVSSYLVEKKITWRFNLERSPWWGGYFEKLVGSVKRCLRKVLGNAKLTFDELYTVL